MPGVRRRFGLLVVLAVALTPALAAADDLESARRLFAEALHDQEEEHHPDIALEKFRLVAKVKDTAQVEYRIGSCLEEMSKLREAALAYGAAARLGLGEEGATDVVESAQKRTAALASQMTKVTVVVTGADGQAVEVTLDGKEKLTSEELKTGALVDSGDHVVDARATGTQPAHATFTATPGAKIDLHLVLQTLPPEHHEPPPLHHGAGRAVAGVALLVGGIGLVASSVGLLVVREDDIKTLLASCPGNVCPTAQQSDLSGARNEAVLFGPLGVTMSIVGAAALGTGIALLATMPRAPRVVPSAGARSLGLSLEGSF